MNVIVSNDRMNIDLKDIMMKVGFFFSVSGAAQLLLQGTTISHI